MSDRRHAGNSQPILNRWNVLIAIASLLVTIVGVVVAIIAIPNDPTPLPAPSPMLSSAPALPPSPTAGPGTPLVPDFVPSQDPPLAPGERRYQLDWADKTVVDLDSGLAERAAEGSFEYEAALDFGRLYTEADSGTRIWGRATVKYLDTSQVSFAGCDQGTRIQDSVAHLESMRDNDSICISTNRGAWAALKIVNAEPSASGLGAGDITFAVRLFKPQI